MGFLSTFIDRNHNLIIWLFVFTLGLSNTTSNADSPMEREFKRIRTANHSMMQLAEARLDLEQFYLDQINSLREKGYASWLEQARQQVAVDSLAGQIDSLRAFDSFVAQLATQVDRTAANLNSDARSEQFRAPVKIYLPGSLRLVGWIEPELATREGNERIEALDRNASFASEDDAIQSAEARVERVQKQNQALAKETDSTPVAWSKQAALQLKLAQAELDFVRLQSDLRSTTQAAATTDIQLDVQVERPDLATAADDADLQLATYRVAWLEANATGRLKSAETELRRQQQRLAAIERLRAEGFATADEVQQSRDLMEESELRLEEERQRLASLQRICVAIESSSSLTAAELRKGFGAQLNSEAIWPQQIRADRARLNHLIDLRRLYFDLQGQRAGTQCELEMRRACAEKLRQAVTASTASISASASHARAGELSATLAAGEKRELESLQLAIETLTAQVQDYDEKMSILAWEEKRFIAQCTQQEQRGDTSFVAVLEDVAAAKQASFSFLESRELDLYDGITQICAESRYLQFTFDQRQCMPVNLSAPLTSSSARRLKSRTEQQLLSRSSIEFRPMQMETLRTGSPVSGPNSLGPVYTGGSGSYYNYPNGILRAELRRQAPVGQIPWYLPGSPNNFRGN
jgi:hypothetical protein